MLKEYLGVISGLVLRLVVWLGGNIIASDSNEEEGHDGQNDETHGIIDFSVSNRFGIPFGTLAIVPVSVFVVVDGYSVAHDFQ